LLRKFEIDIQTQRPASPDANAPCALRALIASANPEQLQKIADSQIVFSSNGGKIHVEEVEEG
jgi:hypothetical protein